METKNVETVDFVLHDGGPGLPPPETMSGQVRVEVGGLSDAGRVRKNNEDHYLVVRFQRALETLLTNLSPGLIPARSGEVGYGLLVADGLGGAAAGEVASEAAIRTIVSLALYTPDWIMRIGEHEAETVMERMVERFRRAGEVLKDESAVNPRLAGMGTTLTGAFTLGTELILTHIGDSRAYLLRDGRLRQLTRDHTLVESLVAAGVVRPDQARSHQLRHVLTQCLGGRANVEAEVHLLTLAHEDQLLLCTDGLTNMVDDATIAAVLAAAPSAQDACQELVQQALHNGGKDNVTVVLARYQVRPAE